MRIAVFGLCFVFEMFWFVCVMWLVICGYCCVVMFCWVECWFVNGFDCGSVNSVV